MHTWFQYLWAYPCTVWVCMGSLCKCVWISPSSIEASHFAVSMCWQKSYTTGCIIKTERQERGWHEYQSLPLCLCAFVWWPSKTSTAILASHRIGLLYKNTPASILQGWSGAEGVGVAEGGLIPQKFTFCILLSDFTFVFNYICPPLPSILFTIFSPTALA